ncbi:hypothetical protein Vafri_15092, partial [Volvox africanus]
VVPTVRQVTVAAPAAQQAQVPFASCVTSTGGMTAASTTTTTAGAVSSLQQSCLSSRKKVHAWGTAAARRRLSADTALTRIIDSCVISPDAAASGTLLAVDSIQQQVATKDDPSRDLTIPPSFATHHDELEQQRLKWVEGGTSITTVDDSGGDCSGQRFSSSISLLLPSLLTSRRRPLLTSSSGDPLERVAFSGSCYFLSLQSNMIDIQQPKGAGARANSSHHHRHVSTTTTAATTTTSIHVGTTTTTSEAVARNGSDGSHHGASTSYLLANAAVPPSLLFTQPEVSGGGQGPTATVSTRCLSSVSMAVKPLSVGLDGEAARKAGMRESSRSTMATPRPSLTGRPQSCDRGATMSDDPIIITTAGGSSSTLARGDPSLSAIRTRQNTSST